MWWDSVWRWLKGRAKGTVHLRGGAKGERDRVKVDRGKVDRLLAGVRVGHLPVDAKADKVAADVREVRVARPVDRVA